MGPFGAPVGKGELSSEEGTWCHCCCAGASIRDAFCTKQVTVFMRACALGAVTLLRGAEDEYQNSQ